MESNVDLSQLALELIAPRTWIFLLQFRFYTRFLCAQSLIECVRGRSSALHRALLFPVGFRAGARPVSLSPIDADMERGRGGSPQQQRGYIPALRPALAPRDVRPEVAAPGL